MSKQPKGVSTSTGSVTYFDRLSNLCGSTTNTPKHRREVKKALFTKWYKKAFLLTEERSTAVLRQCTEACDTQCGRGGTTRSNVAQCAESIALRYSEALQNIRLVALPHLTGRTEDAGSNRHINKGRQMQRRLCVGRSVGSGLADVVAPTNAGSERVKTGNEAKKI
ncbi:hypothetical protein AQ623_10420 [Flavobacterium columnare]|nr:hypothetical protein AQ623_10385 [Flavobacterium columnare]AUX18641.1 hypothetical protein AQ623_10420 [Flavobacterium columnare]